MSCLRSQWRSAAEPGVESESQPWALIVRTSFIPSSFTERDGLHSPEPGTRDEPAETDAQAAPIGLSWQLGASHEEPPNICRG